MTDFGTGFRTLICSNITTFVVCLHQHGPTKYMHDIKLQFPTLQAKSSKAKHGTVVQGEHYKLYEDGVVCKVSPCRNRSFKSEATFGNHAFKKHGLIARGTSAYLYAQNSDDEQKRRQYNQRRRKQPGDHLCTSYYEARGTMQGRWTQAKYRARYIMPAILTALKTVFCLQFILIGFMFYLHSLLGPNYYVLNGPPHMPPL